LLWTGENFTMLDPQQCVTSMCERVVPQLTGESSPGICQVWGHLGEEAEPEMWHSWGDSRQCVCTVLLDASEDSSSLI
jgi:hypothetical protein